MRLIGFAAGFLSMAALAADPKPGIPFRDCDDCPELVIVPPGTITLGSTDAETRAEKVPDDVAARERPPTAFNLKYPIAVARHEVTVGEFQAFVAATKYTIGDGCSAWKFPDAVYGDDPRLGWRNPGFAQTDRDPVVCVSYDDALAYADWVSKKGWFRYRLLSDAEWEYAARAGSTAARPWAEERTTACQNANVHDLDAARKLGGEKTADDHFMCSDGFVHTAPVGSFLANAFGLYDMLGNASEWVADCYNPTWEGLPPLGTARMKGNCTQHVTRGGSWAGKPWTLRSAERDRVYTETRQSPIGFRVARDGAP